MRHEWPPRMVQAFEHFGIDPADSRFHPADPYKHIEEPLCPVCHSHREDLCPNILCALRRTIKADLEARGVPASFCRLGSCRNVTDHPTGGHLCQWCEKQLQPEPVRRRGLKFMDRVADGQGCVERISWIERAYLEGTPHA